MIVLKSQDEIDRMALACRIVAEVLMKIRECIAPGMTTKELDQIAESYILSQKATPAFKGYKGYPATLCTSLNDQVVHGIPGSAVLKEGDIISIDVGVYQGGFYGDAAITLPVGQISQEAGKLLSSTEEALYKGIEKALVGNRLSDISYAVQKHAEADGFSVVKQFVGHGIGRELHEDPQIPNFGKPGQGPFLREGMTLAIEPMINAGTWKVDVLKDGWTAVTRDGRLSAHFEHTVAVTKNGPIILTKFH
ncbi:MAG: type I methionyl aminopeptidase [Nitrospirae bacterium]|nr:type I methionyl aminopeptidase [Nitrospirota bacterium]